MPQQRNILTIAIVAEDGAHATTVTTQTILPVSVQSPGRGARILSARIVQGTCRSTASIITLSCAETKTCAGGLIRGLQTSTPLVRERIERT